MELLKLETFGIGSNNYLLFIGLGVFLLTWATLRRRDGVKHPPGLPSWPLVGSMLYLEPDLHRYFQKLSQKYGPVFSLRMGTLPFLVVSSAEAAEELFRMRDLDFAHRAGSTILHTVSKEIGCNGSNFIYQRFSPRLKFLRKLLVTNLLAPSRMHSSAALRMNVEVGLIEEIDAYIKAGKDVPLGDLLSTMGVTLMNRMCFGDRYYNKTYSQPSGAMAGFKEVMEENMNAVATPYVTDLVPALRFLSPLLYEPKLRRIQRKKMQLFSRIFDDHRTSRKAAPEGSTEQQQDLVDHMLACEGDDKLSEDDMTGVLTDILVGGSDTSVRTVEFAMIELLRKPEILQKLQGEIDSVVGLERSVDESDLPNLPYLQAVTKETLRLHSIVPMLIPRVNEVDSTLGGYHICKGTTVYVNVWALGRDPSLWDNSEEFRPDRFLNSQVNLIGNDYKFLPFGSGRRNCPGLQVGLTVVQRTISTLVHAFDWAPPRGLNPSDISDEELFGMTLRPLVSLVASATPRSTCRFYRTASKETAVS